MNKKHIPQSKIKEELISVSEKEEKEEKRGLGRPTLLTPELKAKLIKLLEEYFFLWIVSAKAGIYNQRIIEWRREQEPFHTATRTRAIDKGKLNRLLSNPKKDTASPCSKSNGLIR